MASGYSHYYDDANAPNARSSLAGPPVQYARGDSSSYRQPRMSREMLNPGNDSYRNSFSTPGKGDDFTPENGWDVYADFNNAGPRYASVKTAGDGYQEIPSPSVKSPAGRPMPNSGDGLNQTPVELVTVPALGAEWKAEELRAMTKKGRKEDQAYSRREKWKRWTRDETGCCGRWGTRRTIVWSLFALIIITGVLLAFMIPRAPKFTFDPDSPLANATNSDTSPQFGTFPANFTFDAALNLQIDTNSNFLPLKFNHLRAEIVSLDTSKLIATGDLGPYTLPAKAYTHVLLPVTFNYTAANTTDQTWANVYNSCRNKNQFTGGVRPSLNLNIALYMDIAGLVTHPATSQTLTNAACPFELPNSAS